MNTEDFQVLPASHYLLKDDDLSCSSCGAGFSEYEKLIVNCDEFWCRGCALEALDFLLLALPLTKCCVCQKEVRMFEPDYCCSGDMCGCRGLPLDPPLCDSRDCNNKYWEEDGAAPLKLIAINPRPEAGVTNEEE